MLKHFTWNMTGYVPKYPVDPSADGIRPYIAERIFQIEPAPPKGAEFATYIYPFIRDAILRFRMGEFSKKYNCDLALAEEYLKVVRGIRNQQSFYITDEYGEETGEDVAIDDSWNYADILWNGIQAETVQRAFHKLNYREQTLPEQRMLSV